MPGASGQDESLRAGRWRLGHLLSSTWDRKTITEECRLASAFRAASSAHLRLTQGWGALICSSNFDGITFTPYPRIPGDIGNLQACAFQFQSEVSTSLSVSTGAKRRKSLSRYRKSRCRGFSTIDSREIHRQSDRPTLPCPPASEAHQAGNRLSSRPMTKGHLRTTKRRAPLVSRNTRTRSTERMASVLGEYVSVSHNPSALQLVRA